MSSTTNNKAPQGGCSDDTTNASGEQQQASSLQLNNVNNNENNSSNATSNDSTIDDNSSAVDTSIADDDDDETSIANNINNEQQLQLQLADDNGSNDNNDNNENELQLSINNNNNDKNKRRWQAVAGSAVATLASTAAVGVLYGTSGALAVSAGTATLVGVGAAYLQYSSNRTKKRLVVDTSSTTIVETSSTAVVETSSITILRGELGPPPVMPPPSELLLQQKHLHEIDVKQNMMNATAFYSTLRRVRSQKENDLKSLRRMLSLCRRQNSGIRNELARASHSLAACATQIQLAQNNATTPRDEVIQVHAKLERTIVIAQQLVIKQNQVLISLVALQKIEVTLVAAKAQAVSTLESATQRRDEVEQRRESLLHAIQSNALAEQKVEEAISEVRDEIDTNERDLTAAQEEERQNERAEESLRKLDIAKAVDDANLECQEVDNLHTAFKDLTNRQEKFAADLKTKLDDNERVVSSKENEISSTRAELALLEQQIAQYKASTAEKMANLRAEVESASQHCQDLVDKAESELKAVRVMHAELTREDGDVMMCQEVGHECRGCLSCSTQSRRVSSSPPAAAAMEEDSNSLELFTILSVESIEAKQFVCDECELTACSQWSGGSFLCLGCSQQHGGIADGLRVIHCKHRELIRENCSSLSDDPEDLLMFDTLVPPSAFCEHKHCRQIVLGHLMPGSNKDLKYCDCGAAVCDECADYHSKNKTCIDDEIDESRAWNDNDDPSDLVYNNLDTQYSHINYRSDPSRCSYYGQLKTDTTPYDTAKIYGTGVESATQFAAHYYIKRWRLPQKTVETLLHFVSRLFNEIEIVSSSEVTSQNKKELENLQRRLKSSVSKSLRLIASNIRKHINDNRYSQGNELNRANAVVTRLEDIADLADTHDDGITSLQQFESDTVQNTLRGIDFPWSDFTDGGSRISVSVELDEPARIVTTRPDIREMNEVMYHVFSRKEVRSNGDVYKFDKCFEPITGRGGAINAEVNHEREINLRVHVCQCILEVFAKNPVRLRNLLNIEDVANLRYVHPEPEDEEEEDDDEDDDVNLRLGDMMDTLSHCDIRDQVLLAVEEGRIDRAMLMRIIREYAQLYVLANEDRVPIMCSTDNNKHYSLEAVEENEMKIISRLNNDDINTARILHDIAVVKNEPKYIQQYVSEQNKHLTFILEQTDLCQAIDEIGIRSTTTTPKHSYEQFGTIVKTSFEAAANEFSDLSHLKNATLENVCPIYSEEDFTDAKIRGAALKKLARELPMIIANECADERCTRNFLDYDIVERGAVDGNHLKRRNGQIPVPAKFVSKHGAVAYIKHVIECKVVANCCYHHSKRDHREQAIIPQKKICLFKNTADIEDIPRYTPEQLLSICEYSANEELVRMQDKVTFSFLELELRGGFSQSVHGCNASDMRCLTDDYFEDLPYHNILFDDLLVASNVETNNSYGMKVISRHYHDIHGTQVSKYEKVAIPFLTGLTKELCGLCDDRSSRPEDMNLTITSPDEQAGIKADHLGTKKCHLSETCSLVSFMNEAICCVMVNCFSDRKITYNQDKAKEKGHCGSYAGILSFRNYDTSEHERSIL